MRQGYEFWIKRAQIVKKPSKFVENAGGEAGIRTLGRVLKPYNGLANRRLQPLGHLTVSKTLGNLKISVELLTYKPPTVPKTVPRRDDTATDTGTVAS